MILGHKPFDATSEAIISVANSLRQAVDQLSEMALSLVRTFSELYSLANRKRPLAHQMRPDK